MHQARECDILVVGGGPAGSTISTLLSRKGWRVTVLEKDVHPRFHIGESLLPHNLRIFERLGVLDEVKQIGRFKPGADFTAPGHEGHVSARFELAFDPCPANSYQVRRADLDHLLIRTAAKSGATVLEGVKATHVEFRDDATVRVVAAPEDGDEQVWTARFLVDASGRDTFLGNRLRIKKRNPRHSSAALYAHFSGVKAREGSDTGNISIYWFEHGWFWSIPLTNDVTSIGAVCVPEYLQSRRGSAEAFLDQTIKLCPPLAARTTTAKIVSPAAATGNYSYSCNKMFGRRYLMIGDAFSFIDPVFSSGVFLAMQGAVFGADTVDACLRKPMWRIWYQRRHAAKVRRGLGTLSWFIYRFNRPAFRRLFMQPRNTLRMQQGIISFLAGDVYGNPRLRVPFAAFKLVYLATSIGMARSRGHDRGAITDVDGAFKAPAREP